MKLGVLNLGWWHESQAPGDVLKGIIKEAELADELGYYSFWTGEHHFTHHGIVGDTMQMAAAIAVRTQRIRIGSAVVVLPFQNPVRIAEQAATVDLLSDGRLDVGLGRGYQRREFNGLGVPIEEARERYEDALEIILKCWAEGPIEHESAFWPITADDGDPLQVFPKPIQQPHPPLYQASSISPASIEFAASRRMPIMTGGPTDLRGVAIQAVDMWRAKMRELGNDPDGVSIPCTLNVYVAETDARAHADYAEIDPEWDQKLLAKEGMPTLPDGSLPKGYEEWASRRREVKREVPLLVGSPETVTERLMTLDSQGIDYVVAMMGMPDMPRGQILSTIELFGREVLPHLTAGRDLAHPTTAART